MKHLLIFTLVVLIFIPVTFSYTEEISIEDTAKDFIDLLAHEKFAEAIKLFTEESTKPLSENILASIWKSLIFTLGKFNGILDIKTPETQIYKIVIVSCDFELGTLKIQISFDRGSKIAGLYFSQPQLKAVYMLPSYIAPDSYTEVELTIQSNGWSLPAILTLPKADKPCPAVVLVHGSGPQDRDETIGPNKPFKDIALGLASKGIAVLRYEKRTKQYGDKTLVKGFTVNEETIEDAISAINLLYQRDDIDKGKIFLLGHSLGGMLAPRIAEKTDKLRGIVIMAGAFNDLLELMLKQIIYSASLDNNITKEEKDQIEDIKRQMDLIRSRKIDKDEFILGAPGSYWLDLIEYKPLEILKRINIPVLILHGDRDFQVSTDDFSLWKEELKDKGQVLFKLYKGLNHLFIFGEGKPTISEYYRPGNVSKEVIEDIANWILSIQS